MQSTIKKMTLTVFGGLLATSMLVSDASAQDASKGKALPSVDRSPKAKMNPLDAVPRKVKPRIQDFRPDYGYRHRRYPVKPKVVKPGEPFIKTVRVEKVEDRQMRVSMVRHPSLPAAKPVVGYLDLAPSLRESEARKFVGQVIRVKVQGQGRWLKVLEVNVPQAR